MPSTSNFSFLHLVVIEEDRAYDSNGSVAPVRGRRMQSFGSELVPIVGRHANDRCRHHQLSSRGERRSCSKVDRSLAEKAAAGRNGLGVGTRLAPLVGSNAAHIVLQRRSWVHSFQWNDPSTKLTGAIKLTGNDHSAIEVGDPAQADSERSKPLTFPLAAVVQPVVVVTVKRYRHAHGAREVVKDLESMRMSAAGLVRDQHVSPQRAQLVDVCRKDGGPVSALGSITPSISRCRCSGQLRTRTKLWPTRQRGIPNGLSENATETSNFRSVRQRDHAPVKIPVGQRAVEDVLEVAG